MIKHFALNNFVVPVAAVLLSAWLAISGVSHAQALPVNVNTASQTELETIKGIGPAKARTIIAEREDGGHFQDANDLQKRVRGIGMKSVEKMVDNGLTIESPSSFREPHGRTKKEGSASSRRSSRNQGNTRNHQDRPSTNRRN
ncbi:DNA-binding protein [Polynucleobacter paneuropaeus]|nr:DNA-binding protein [Polynucleobacter paneuropaeus]MBT8611051.1 DNA-binding protein [Polynucleobacter paneuropaeus]